MFDKMIKTLPFVGLLIAVIIGFPAMYMWGQSATETKNASIIEKLTIQYLHEKEAQRKECEQNFFDLKAQQAKDIESIQKKHTEEIAILSGKFRMCEDELTKYKKPIPEPVQDIFVAGHFANGLEMGSNTSTGKTDWVTRLEDIMQIAYPGGAEWGAWFISVGTPTPERAERGFIDASKYSKLELEIKGKAGDTVVLALKDKDDPDDGTESRVHLVLKSNDWETYEIALTDFKTADLKKLYTVTSFVFAKKAQTIFVRKIKFI